MIRILTIFGTRPEAIKIAPVVREIQKHPDEFESTISGQHREMLDQVLRIFAIQPDVDLDLMQENQELASLSACALTAVTDVLGQVNPHLVLVQGDT